MWYEDLLLVMLLVVLALLVFTAILVATKIRKPKKRTVSTLEVTNQEPSTVEDKGSVSGVIKETVYEKLYSEPQEDTEVSSSIGAQPAAIQEDNILTQINLDNEQDSNQLIDDDLDEEDDFEEWENENADTVNLPYVPNLDDVKQEQTELIQPHIALDSEEVLDDDNQKNEDVYLNPNLNNEKNNFFFDYKGDVENEDSEEGSEFFFNLEPQPLEDLTDEENYEIDKEDPHKTLEIEPSSQTATDMDTSSENHRQDERNGLGVTICPHCNAKVPATLYCIICGRPMKE